METNMLGVQPTMPIGRSDSDGMGGGWFWIIVLFFLFFGFGNGNGFAGGNNIQNDFLTRDLFNMQQANASCCCETQKGIMESTYQTQLGMQNLGQQLSSCCCETNRNIDSVRADAYRNTCDITTAIHAEGEATRALINANTMQDLRDKLADRDRDLLVAELVFNNQKSLQGVVQQLQPTPIPAYPVCPVEYNPYVPYGAKA